MTTPFHRAALIVGAGHGLSAALARRLAREGMLVALAARNVDKIADVAEQTGAATYACDATDPAAVRRLFAAGRNRASAFPTSSSTTRGFARAARSSRSTRKRRARR